MSGMISKSRIPWVRRDKLHRVVRTAVIDLKKKLKNGPYPKRHHGRSTEFCNSKGKFSGAGPSPLPPPGKSIARYVEMDVGQAHPGDTLGIRGTWRLVAGLDKSGQRLEVLYLTVTHYAKTEFFRIE